MCILQQKPIHPEGLSNEQFAKGLEYLMLLKEKRSGVIKGHGCADGHPQRLYTGKAESASPTVLMESVLLTAAIEAREHRTVYTAERLCKVIRMRSYIWFYMVHWQQC